MIVEKADGKDTFKYIQSNDLSDQSPSVQYFPYHLVLAHGILIRQNVLLQIGCYIHARKQKQAPL